MKEQKIEFVIQVFQEEDLPSDYQHLITEAKLQTTKAYAPYSEFNVGSAVLLDNGSIIGGNNQENAAYPSGLCAERVALFYANAQFPQEKVKAIAIAAFTNGTFTENPISPCGACRQVLLETENRFNNNIAVLLYGQKEIYLIKRVSDLLPISFKL